MNPRRLFVASCISLVTSAFTFVVRGDILQPLGKAFNLTQQENGSIEGAVFLGMAVSMFIGGFVCDLIGMKRIMVLAFLSHLGGVFGTIFAPHSEISFQWLFASSFLMGCGNGLVETAINPLAATLFPKQKTHFLNILHAWWPGGLVIGGLLASLVGNRGLGLPWQASLCLIIVPCLAYGAMLIGQQFPSTERVASGVTTADMFKEVLRPAFILWMICMLMTAATELGPQKWQESVLTQTAGIKGTLILVYTSGMMFVLRHFAGPLAHALSPVGMLTLSATLSAIGLYLLSTADSALTAIAYATIFGFGIAYFWPTMLGVAAERFPKGGALILGLMGTAGNLSIAYVLPQMGQIYDYYAVQTLRQTDPSLAGEVVPKDKSAIDPALAEKIEKDGQAAQVEALKQANIMGARMAFRWVSVLPCILIVIFGAIAITDHLRGGYKAVHLDQPADKEKEIAASLGGTAHSNGPVPVEEGIKPATAPPPG
jgi:MFS family permease